MEQKKSNGTGRLRPIELSFQPVFDIHLNMAIDYEISMRINDKTVGVDTGISMDAMPYILLLSVACVGLFLFITKKRMMREF